MANTFTSLIRCTNCNSNYRHIKERGVSKYVCSGYTRKNGCVKRNILHEQVLLNIVQIYCNRNKINLIEDNIFMKSIINIIEIDNQHNITVKYKNGEIGIFHQNDVHI